MRDAETQINEQKSKPLYKMFNSIPRRYDLMNRMLTLRFDESWRKKAIKECLSVKPMHIIDLCTGTGDMAIRTASTADYSPCITAMDFSENMLEYASKKAERKGVLKKIEFVKEDASRMSFKDNSFDAATISFAFRNLTFRNPISEAALNEIYRIVKPGGRFIVAESSQPKNKVVRPIVNAYLNLMVKRFGGMLSGHKSAYNYLAYSAKNYYSAEEVDKLLLAHGFKSVEHRSLLFGIAAIHIATK